MLTAESLSFWYDVSAPPIVYNCTFEVDDGEFVAIVGESGSGKSTLLRFACGLLQLAHKARPEAGYLLRGFVQYGRTRLSAPHRDFGYVPQNFQAGLAPWLTAMDNVLLSVGRPYPTHSRARASELLEEAGIIDVAHLNVMRLSGGQQQRVAVCRALMTEPKVLFMDEPFANLDSMLKPEMSELLRELRCRHAFSLMLVTHDIETVKDLADRILGVKRGYGVPEYQWWSRADFAAATIEQWMVS